MFSFEKLIIIVIINKFGIVNNIMAFNEREQVCSRLMEYTSGRLG